MDTSNVIALVLGGTSLIISVIGFIIAPTINLKSKRLEVRLQLRLFLFDKVFVLQQLIVKDFDGSLKEITDLIFEINKLVQLYGYKEEIQSFKDLKMASEAFGTENNKDISNRNSKLLEKSKLNLKNKFESFFDTLLTAYRKEILLEKYLM